ncbi:MAG: hypothetical protein ABI707_17150 [Ferruginibacter sp.]
MKFGDYLEQVKEGTLELWIFLFNIFQHASRFVNDFSWPQHLMNAFVKNIPCCLPGERDR